MDKKEQLFNTDLSVIREGNTEIFIHKSDKNTTPSKSMAVFYNKKMEINRDISNIAILAYNKLFNQSPLIIVDPMAGSGVGSIRMLKECKNIKKIYINDINPFAVEIIYKNLNLNEIKYDSDKLVVSKKDAIFLFSEISQNSKKSPENKHSKPNIISIDPFGTPNLYLDGAFKSIQKKDGLLCVTATDTAVLFGIKSKTCIRKYMSKPLRTEYSKEIGARILVHFISRIANVNKMGIIPILTFYTSHFIRVFCLTFKNQNEIFKYFKGYGYIIHCDNCGYRATFKANVLNIEKECPVCKNYSKIEYAGPLWINKIHDLKFVKKMIKINEKLKLKNNKRIDKLLNLIKEELDLPISYYNIHKLSKELKIPTIPKLETLINTIRKKGYCASRTHFDYLSIKTTMDLESLRGTLLELKIN
ncbi:MAG: tRNA (guanine(26)-N(2)/guanine(27)-N(2))-dimethyltransferase [Candidatus Lokiarchaeum sp. GC14_75]|nr:MAG: tRNA (guanine(26)-N(2)/guanine(27)-N(2))-dimethyltransferase [Candidatus Lokiarchaeum sp. GC14_75]